MSASGIKMLGPSMPLRLFRSASLLLLASHACWYELQWQYITVVHPVQERPSLSALDNHISQVPWPQLLQECVLSCLAAACAGLAVADVLRAYRQVGLPLLECGLHVP